MLLSLTAFSQTATVNKNDTSFTLPARVGRLAVIDIIKGDECKSALTESKSTIEILLKLKNINANQIKVYEEKIDLYKTEISLYQEKEIKYNETVQCLTTKLDKSNKRNRFLTIACSALAVTTGLCFLLN